MAVATLMFQLGTNEQFRMGAINGAIETGHHKGATKSSRVPFAYPSFLLSFFFAIRLKLVPEEWGVSLIVMSAPDRAGTWRTRYLMCVSPPSPPQAPVIVPRAAPQPVIG